MFLNKLSLINFKNYESLSLELEKPVSCFVGSNGEGKTNILDAIYYLSFCKSFFSNADSQNIRFEAPFFVIEGSFDSGDIIYCSLKRGAKKIFKKNKKEYEKLSQHIGLIPAVVISPNDSILIHEGSEVRRKFVDGTISQAKKNYLEKLLQYNKAVIQRNKLLKIFAEKNYFDEDSLEVWDDQIIGLSAYISTERQNFISEFQSSFQDFHEKISGKAENADLKLKSDVLNDNFELIFRQNRPKDQWRQHTTMGAHRDDLIFTMNDNTLKKYGSQGQQKSFLMALKLAQYAYLKDKMNHEPLLLMDDIFDRLDYNRVEHLMKIVKDEKPKQVFITDMHETRLSDLLRKIKLKSQIFLVNENNVVVK